MTTPTASGRRLDPVALFARYVPRGTIQGAGGQLMRVRDENRKKLAETGKQDEAGEPG